MNTVFEKYLLQQAEQQRLFGIDPDYDQRYNNIRHHFVRSYSSFIAGSNYDHYDDLMSHFEDERMYYTVGARSIQLIKDKIAYREQKAYFKAFVVEELIAKALHPCRIQAQMDHYEDIEQFFEAL